VRPESPPPPPEYPCDETPLDESPELLEDDPAEDVELASVFVRFVLSAACRGSMRV
jgi:hypothetical protein